MDVFARPLLRTAAVAAAAAVVMTLAGCATRYDASGREVYVWQFGQDTDRTVDYSDPRLPILPRWRPRESLWPVPSPWGVRDLSPYSFLAPDEGSLRGGVPLGDNAGCAASCTPYARLALLAPRADARGGGTPAAR